jgi:hypothetical protein
MFLGLSPGEVAWTALVTGWAGLACLAVVRVCYWAAILRGRAEAFLVLLPTLLFIHGVGLAFGLLLLILPGVMWRMGSNLRRECAERYLDVLREREDLESKGAGNESHG